MCLQTSSLGGEEGGEYWVSVGWQCLILVKVSCYSCVLTTKLGYCTKILCFLNPSPQILKSPKPVSHQLSPSQQSHLPWPLCTKAFPSVISLLQYYWHFFLAKPPQTTWIMAWSYLLHCVLDTHLHKFLISMYIQILPHLCIHAINVPPHSKPACL